jgi:hypothetical protein
MLFESSGSLLSTSDDEIVWSVSDSDLSLSSESSVFPTSDDDYVVLGLPQRSSQISTGQSISDTDEILAPRLSGLSLDESSISGGSGRTLVSPIPIGRTDAEYPAHISANKATGNVKKTKKRTAKKRKAKKIQAEPVLVHSRAGGATVQNRPKKAVARAGPPGARSDNDSEKTYSDSEDIRGTAAHKEAVQYITSYVFYLVGVSSG